MKRDSISDIVRNISLHCSDQNGSRTHSTLCQTNRDLPHLPKGKAVAEWRQLLVEIKNKRYHRPQSNHPIRLQGVELHTKRDSCITVDPIRLQHIPTVHKDETNVCRISRERIVQSHSLTKWSNISLLRRILLDVGQPVSYPRENVYFCKA